MILNVFTIKSIIPIHSYTCTMPQMYKCKTRKQHTSARRFLFQLSAFLLESMGFMFMFAVTHQSKWNAVTVSIKKTVLETWNDFLVLHNTVWHQSLFHCHRSLCDKYPFLVCLFCKNLCWLRNLRQLKEKDCSCCEKINPYHPFDDSITTMSVWTWPVKNCSITVQHFVHINRFIRWEDCVKTRTAFPMSTHHLCGGSQKQ